MALKHTANNNHLTIKLIISLLLESIAGNEWLHG